MLRMGRCLASLKARRKIKGRALVKGLGGGYSRLAIGWMNCGSMSQGKRIQVS